MADQKKNLPVADDQKAPAAAQEPAAASSAEPKKKIRKAPRVKKPRKKGLPLAVDILIVVTLVALIVGAGWGIYTIGNLFATRYAQKEITYMMLLDDVDAVLAYNENGKCVVLPDTDVFVLEQEQSTLVGEVLSVSTEKNADGTVDIYVSVRTTANYNYTLGYFVDDVKIAVGKAYDCRFCGLAEDAVIVELQVTEKES